MLKQKQYRDDGVVISTVSVTPFLDWYGPYETGISFDGGNKWKIVEGYNYRADAVIGHKKYCAMSKEELENLKSIE